ncbi:ribonuclease H [Pseudoscardovia radai]|uniref:ribonuclease H family protein n=1 Tax=Pseudoscardovia radai TaxID=987066 RepID=UPI003995ABA3
MADMSTITVSTDGSALGNPNGAMGWAWADHEGGRCDAGGAANGTNQIGELCAVLQALRTHRGADTLVIESDSQYAINCSTKWLRGWKRNGWHNSQKQPVKNATIIKAIDYEISHREGAVKFSWVKGHAGDEFNEKCDTLARGYAEQCKQHGTPGYLPIEGWHDLIASPYAANLRVPDDVRAALETGIASVSRTIASTPEGAEHVPAPARTRSGASSRRAAGPASRAGAGSRAAAAASSTSSAAASSSSASSSPRHTPAHAAAPHTPAHAAGSVPAPPVQGANATRAASAARTASSTHTGSASRTASASRASMPAGESPDNSVANLVRVMDAATRRLLEASERLDAATGRYERAAARLETAVRRLDDTTGNNKTQGTLF